MKRIACALALGLASVSPAAADTPGDFDFYVLSLSWSPTYCSTRGGDRDRMQCGEKPYAFVMHGLWPQYERGFPSQCRVTGRNPTRAQVDDMLSIMPSPGLVRHEWREHGTCSGLDPARYFALARDAFAKVKIPAPMDKADSETDLSPADIERAFIDANPKMKPSGIAVQCSGGMMTEVRVCMTKDLDFRPCADVDRRACRASRVTLPKAGY